MWPRYCQGEPAFQKSRSKVICFKSNCPGTVTHTHRIEWSVKIKVDCRWKQTIQNTTSRKQNAVNITHIWKLESLLISNTAWAFEEAIDKCNESRCTRPICELQIKMNSHVHHYFHCRCPGIKFSDRWTINVFIISYSTCVWPSSEKCARFIAIFVCCVIKLKVSIVSLERTLRRKSLEENATDNKESKLSKSVSISGTPSCNAPGLCQRWVGGKLEQWGTAAKIFRALRARFFCPPTFS